MSNQEIYKKCSKGKKNPYKNDQGIYNILYKTTCLVNGKVYVGVHSTRRLNDRYIGCGIKNAYSTSLKDYRNPDLSSLGNLVRKYGVECFVREDLLFFDTADEALEQEKRVVDRDWVKDWRTLNLKFGGFRPPVKCLSDNGNFGRKWSPEMKRRLSDIRKANGKSIGSSNPNAKPIVLIDVETLEVKEFDSAYEAQKTISPGGNVGTLRTFLQKQRLFERKWVPLYREVYLSIKDIKSLVMRFIEESRFKNQIKSRLKWE